MLRDPRQRRFFKARDLTDLFTLGDEYAGERVVVSVGGRLGSWAAGRVGEERVRNAGGLVGGGSGQICRAAFLVGL